MDVDGLRIIREAREQRARAAQMRAEAHNLSAAVQQLRLDMELANTRRNQERSRRERQQKDVAWRD